MKIKRTPISSVSSPDTAHPWFDFDFDPAGAVTIKAANGLQVYSKGKVTPQKEAALQRRFTLTLTAGKETVPHVLAVTEEGDVEFVPIDEQRPVYYAHLGFYDPATDTLELLEFVSP